MTSFDAVGTSGAPAASLPAGVVFWRLAARSGASTSASRGPTWELRIGARSAAVDTSWGSFLDVDGDGHADVAVGNPDGATLTGHAVVHMGSATGAAAIPTTTLEAPDPGACTFGYVAGAGDVNGDGYGDLFVGAPGGMACSGRGYIYLGSPTGLEVAPSTVVTGSQGFGAFAASAGDVNGDGYGDMIVGENVSTSGAGVAHIFLGSMAGLGTTPATTLVGPDSGNFGVSVASAGDVNGDGFGDVVVGANFALSNTGRAYVYLGSAAGVATSPATTLTGPDGAESYFGVVAGIGDTNGDGFADIAVGASVAMSQTGRAYVYLGGASGLADAPSVALTGPDGANGQFGAALSAAGDLDGDGYADLIVGAYVASAFTGRAYVYRGGAMGIGSVPIPLDAASGAGDRFASRVRGGGDVDRDGYDDVVVGSLRSSFLYLGTSARISPSPAVTFDGGFAAIASGVDDAARAARVARISPPITTRLWRSGA